MVNTETITQTATQTINSIRESISKISLESIKDIIYASTDEQIYLRNKCILIGITAITVIIAIWVYRIIRNKLKSTNAKAEAAKAKADKEEANARRHAEAIRMTKSKLPTIKEEDETDLSNDDYSSADEELTADEELSAEQQAKIQAEKIAKRQARSKARKTAKRIDKKKKEAEKNKNRKEAKRERQKQNNLNKN
ncbi:hypothetical protein NEIRO02_1890 [Nematocida sp. AWRm79]|nr:hypothetical protein NEIRO02_1890 [Nematocida sp. AWRm79]